MDDQAANDCDLEHVAYEFFTQAFVLYEEEIAVIFPQLVSSSYILVDKLSRKVVRQ